MAKIINSQEFDNTIESGVVVVDFFATWCGPCKMLSPVIDELSGELENVNFVKVDIDQSMDLAQKFKIVSVPTLKVFKNGEEVDTESEVEFAATVINSDEVTIDNKGNNSNIMEAISQGANDGMNMALGIGASLVAIIALVALVNGGLSIVGLSLEGILSYVFAPIGFFMGIPKDSILTAGQLLGSKLALNEFVAFGELGPMLKTLDYRTGLMMAISLTGFANISSMGKCKSGISVI